MVAGRTSILLLSSDKLLVCERKAFTIVPSIPPLFPRTVDGRATCIVYYHVVIAMAIVARENLI